MENMKTIANKTQKTFEACIIMLMNKEGKSFQEAQDTVLEVVKEFQNTPKQKILWIDMGAYGFTITDDSEGMSSIDYSTLVIR